MMQYTWMMDDNDDNGSDDVVLTIDAEIVYDTKHMFSDKMIMTMMEE